MENQWVWTKLEIKICFLRQFWTKSCRQIHKIKQYRFFYGLFYSWFFATFYQKTSNFCFWVDGWVLAMKSKYFMDFLKISEFPKILSLKSFSNLWGNSWHLWWRQIVLKSEKVCKYFVKDCSRGKVHNWTWN